MTVKTRRVQTVQRGPAKHHTALVRIHKWRATTVAHVEQCLSWPKKFDTCERACSYFTTRRALSHDCKCTLSHFEYQIYLATKQCCSNARHPIGENFRREQVGNRCCFLRYCCSMTVTREILDSIPHAPSQFTPKTMILNKLCYRRYSSPRKFQTKI